MQVALAAGLVASCMLAASSAAAAPAIVLDKCPAFPREQLHAAIVRELVASKVEHEVTIVVACPDAVTAHVSIEPAMGLERSLDLGEVPGDLRVKLLAIAAVELAVAADPTRLRGPASERAGDAPPLPATPPAPPSREVAAAAEEPSRETLREDELPPAPVVPARFALSPRLGVRIFTDQGKPLPQLAIEAEIERFAVGISATRGTAVEDPLGTLTPYLLTASASVRLGCWGIVQLACVRVRIEAGLAGVGATAYTPMVAANDAHSFYGQAGLGLDVEHSFGAVGFVAAAEAAWSEGLVATAQDREAVRLDGLAITTLLGLRWRP